MGVDPIATTSIRIDNGGRTEAPHITVQFELAFNGMVDILLDWFKSTQGFPFEARTGLICEKEGIMKTSKTFKHLFDDGFETHHSDGSKSDTYKNALSNGHTTYHSDGSTSKTYKNALNDGYTTYHSDGSTSKTYKNTLDDGYTTFHSDGSTSKTYKNSLFGGFTTYHSDSGLGELSGMMGGILAGFIILLSIISLFSLGKFAVVSIILILVSIVCRILLNVKHGTVFYTFWAHPFTLLGWRFVINTMWSNSNGNFLEPFGVVFIAIGILASLFRDCSENFAMFMYAFMTTFAMILVKSWGDHAPYFLIGVMLVIALFATLAMSGKSNEEM